MFGFKTRFHICDLFGIPLYLDLTTIFIMLKRLIAKGAVRLDDSGRVQVYYAEISREEMVPEETSSFLSRVFDGSLGMMVSSLVSHRALSEEELSELRNILDEAEKNRKS